MIELDTFRCGHPRSDENTVTDRKGEGYAPRRRCRECHNAGRRDRNRVKEMALLLPPTIETTRAADWPHYAGTSRWGQFSTRVLPAHPVRCGLCGSPAVTQGSKAAHLRRAHGADVVKVTLPTGATVYEWAIP